MTRNDEIRAIALELAEPIQNAAARFLEQYMREVASVKNEQIHKLQRSLFACSEQLAHCLGNDNEFVQEARRLLGPDPKQKPWISGHLSGSYDPDLDQL